MNNNATHTRIVFQLAGLLLLWLLPLSLFAQHDFSSQASSGQTLYYKILNANEVEVTFADDGNNFPYFGYKKPEGNLAIPFQVDWQGKKYVVRGIGDRAFKACVKLKTVSIPSTVESIGDRAFYFCDGLTTVVIPSSIQKIGEKAFDVCFSLDDATKKALGIEEIKFRRRTPRELNLEQPVTISVDYRSVTIMGAKGKTIDLYDAQGRKLKNLPCQTESIVLQLPAQGSYMLKVGDESFRVVAK